MGTSVVLWLLHKNINIGMHSDASILFKFVWWKIILYSTFWYVQLTLTLIQGHRGARKQKLQRQLSHKVFNWFEWNLVYCWDLVVWWMTEARISSIQYSRERTLLTWFLFFKKRTFDIGFYLYIYKTDVFQTWVWWYQKLQCPFSHKFKYRFWWSLVCCHNFLVCLSSC